MVDVVNQFVIPTINPVLPAPPPWWFILGVSDIGPTKKYTMRGWDTGSGGRFVYWSSYEPSSLPSSTTPPVTGTLVNIQVVD